MKKIMRFFCLSFLISASLNLPAIAQCTNANVTGTYGLQLDGSVLAGPATGPFGGIALSTFDGAGKFNAALTASFGGTFPLPAFFPIQGTYRTNSDCTVDAIEVTLGLNIRYYILNGGDELWGIQTDAFTSASFVLKKQNISACTVASMADAFAFQSAGRFASGPNSGPFIAAGRITVDRTGKIVFGDSAFSVNGTILSNSFSGSIQVNPDCTFSASLTDQTGATANWSGVLVDKGRQFFFIFTNPTLIISGHAKQVTATP